MKTTFAALIMVFGLGSTLVLAEPYAPEPPPPAAPQAVPVPADVQDVVYFAENRPVLMRLHVRVNGKPLRANYDAFIDEVFRYLDVDGNGFVDEKEASRLPSVAVLFGSPGFRNPIADGRGQPTTFKQLDKNGDGKVSRAELASYYREHGVASFQVQTGGNAGNGTVIFTEDGRLVNGGDNGNADRLNKALFALLDPRKDGKLTRADLAAGAAALMKLDANDDEMITPDELLRETAAEGGDGIVFRAQLGGNAGPATSDGSFFVVEPGKGAQLARQLLVRYGKVAEPMPGMKLSRAQLGLDIDTFTALDSDKDGQLDASELAKFAERAPDLEMRVRIGQNGDQGRPNGFDDPARRPPGGTPRMQPSFGDLVRRLAGMPRVEQATPVQRQRQGNGPGVVVEVVPPKDRQSLPTDAVEQRTSGPLVKLGRTRLDFQTGGGNTGGGDFFIVSQGLEEAYLDAFKMLDTMNKGYITEEQAKNSRVFRNVFKLMDRDGDGMLYEKEIREYVSSMQSLEAAAARATVTMTLSDSGRGLFDLIDKDHDGRLSVRELRQLPDLLKTLDPEGTGAITLTDVPRNLRVSFQGGSPGGFRRGQIILAGGFGGGGQARGEPAPPPKGPVWFVKMDRNHDGDVSRREFLGTDAQFKEIDTDGDGLISLEEAEAYDRKMRDRKDKGDR